MGKIPKTTKKRNKNLFIQYNMGKFFYIWNLPFKDLKINEFSTVFIYIVVTTKKYSKQATRYTFFVTSFIAKSTRKLKNVEIFVENEENFF